MKILLIGLALTTHVQSMVSNMSLDIDIVNETSINHNEDAALLVEQSLYNEYYTLVDEHEEADTLKKAETLYKSFRLVSSDRLGFGSGGIGG